MAKAGSLSCLPGPVSWVSALCLRIWLSLGHLQQFWMSPFWENCHVTCPQSPQHKITFSVQEALLFHERHMGGVGAAVCYRFPELVLRVFEGLCLDLVPGSVSKCLRKRLIWNLKIPSLIFCKIYSEDTFVKENCWKFITSEELLLAPFPQTHKVHLLWKHLFA